MKPSRIVRTCRLTQLTVAPLAVLLTALFIAPPTAHSAGGASSGGRGRSREGGQANCHEGEVKVERAYDRSVISVDVPDVTLTDTDGAPVSLRASLDQEKPVMLNFIFTTCPTICPLMSALFSTTREGLGGDREKLRMVSISIDPEHDTPAVLRTYARKMQADDDWLFLTGDLADIVAVQRAFGAWRGNKMSHRPLTFLRQSPGSQWVRVEGIVRASDLEQEAREMLSR